MDVILTLVIVLYHLPFTSGRETCGKSWSGSCRDGEKGVSVPCSGSFTDGGKASRQMTCYYTVWGVSCATCVRIVSEVTTVAVGGNIVLECVTQDDKRLTWRFRGVMVQAGGRVMIRQSDSTPRSSLLTIERARLQDGGQYICMTTPVDHDEAIITVINAADQVKKVRIDEPIERQLTVEVMRSFTLKCIAENGADIQWLHNDFPISESPRAVITTQKLPWAVTSILTKRAVRLDSSGEYTCADKRDSRNKDVVQVSVIDQADGKAPVEIMDLSSSTLTVMVSQPIMLRCMGDETTNLDWLKEKKIVSLEPGFNVKVAYDPVARRRYSLLSKESAELRDSGTYTCKNADISTDMDTVALTVRNEGEEDIQSAPARRDVRNMTLRVGSPINLQCSLGAAGDHIPEWSKDDTIITSEHKYSIKNSIPTELKIHNANRFDAGIYKCSFKAIDTGQVSGVVIFNITLSPCRELQEPAHGLFLQCPRLPVYGDACTFACDPGFKLSSPQPLVCERYGNHYRWSHPLPVCHKMTEQDYLESIATTISSVLLRVGDLLKLQCGVGAVWTRFGRPLVNGTKYSFHNAELVVNNTNREDTGIYDCNIYDEDKIIGIKKFNVTTLPCPKLKAPLNGSILDCPSQSSYGQTCSFKCDHNFELTGSRSRTCELAHSQTETYWTGEMAVCTNRHFAWFHGGGSALRQQNMTTYLISLLLLAFFCHH